MNIEEGLLSALIEKLREELRGMIRYELSRGLDKPEANIWSVTSTGALPFSSFLSSTLVNSLYSKETILVSEYLETSQNLLQKFHFFKDTGKYFLPSEAFFTVSYLNDLLSGAKKLLHSSELYTDLSLFNEIKGISHLILSLPCISEYVPSNFTKSHHDPDYLSRVLISLNSNAATELCEKYKIFNEISQFQIQKINFSFSFSFNSPEKIVIQSLCDTIGSVLEALQSVQDQEAACLQAIKAETENKRIVQELSMRSRNDEAFDRLLEESN